MNIDPVAPADYTVEQYVRTNLTGARRWLNEAHGLLAQRPAAVPQKEHIDQAVAAAYNAAECLYDVGQIDEPDDAVREALLAAETIMDVIRKLENPRPPFMGGGVTAATQLLDVDRTLAALELRLGAATDH